jgi:hypothetical protein
MPVTPFSPDDEGMPDWLQRMLGGVAPGGGAMEYPRSMTGQNMGYPALGGGIARSTGGPPGWGGVTLSNLGGIGNPAMAGVPPPAPPAPPIGINGPGPGYPALGMWGVATGGPGMGYPALGQAPPFEPNFPAPAAPQRAATATPSPAAAAPGGGRASPAATATAAPAAPVRTPGAPNLGYYNPRFVQIDRPDMDPAGGRRGGGPPQMTALNLAGLFGGGRQQQPAPAPAPAPAAAAPAATPSGPFDQATVNRGVANYPGHWAMSPDQIASYMKTQPWLRNLGGAAAQQMTPGQLAQAVHRPRWWQNV